MRARAASLRLLLLPALALLLWPAPARAQQHPNKDNGFSAEKSFHLGDLDSVNAMNGNLVITIPIGLRYGTGGGFSYGLTLVYNSNVWEVDKVGPQLENNKVVPGRNFTAGLGWTLSLGQMLAPNHPANHTNGFVYVAQDGSHHQFFDRLHPAANEDPVTGVFYSRDGSYLRLKTTGGTQLELPDGAIHTFDSQGRVTKIADRFGNFLKVTYIIDPQLGFYWKLEDSLGRIHTVRFYGGQPYYARTVKEVELAAFGTQLPAKWKFTYDTTKTFETSCPNHLPPNSYQVPVLTDVELPDGSHYSIAATDYQPSNTGDSNTCDDLSGVLRRLTLPTRGKIEWDYGAYIFPTEGDRCRDFFASTVGVSKRRLVTAGTPGTVHGEWQYLTDRAPFNCQDNITWNEMVNTVITPLKHKTETFFSVSLAGGAGGWTPEEYGLPVTHGQPASGGRYLSKRIHRNTNPDPDGVPTYSHVRSEYLTYEWDTGTLPVDDRKSNQRIKATRTVYHDDGGTVADTTFVAFDGVGHYRTTATSGNFAAGNARTETTNFNPDRGTYPGSFEPLETDDPWVLTTYTERTATEGASTVKSEAVFEPATGFLACARAWRLSGGRGTNDVLVIYGRDAAGNVTSEADYGGDTQTVGTGGVCTLNAQNPLIPPAPPAGTSSPPAYQLLHGYSSGTLAVTQYAGANFFSVNRLVDAKTGLVSRSCDVAGICTNYTYDQLGRITSDKHTTDSHTIYNYVAAGASNTPRVDILEKNNAETVVLADSKVVFDDFGRVYDEYRTMPDASQSRKRTFYEAEGWKSTVSETIKSGPGATWNRYQSYDPFGRPGRIKPADMLNSEDLHNIDLTYFGVQTVTRTTSLGTVAGTTTGEADVTTTEVYDRQGRLFKVQEPSNADGSLATTTYAYDAGGRLTQVTQATANGTQVRTFGYDGRGFLTQETHPEKDPVGGYEVRYTGYDARGHARCKLDGGVGTGYVYDAAERLTAVQEVDANCNFVRDLKTFTYGDISTSSNKALGRVVTAVRHNYVDLGTAPLPYKGSVIETYTYGGQGGRVSEKLTEWKINDLTTNDLFLQRFFYDHRGQVTQLDYPKCLYCGVPTLAKSVYFNHTQGFLTAVPSYASAITYHPNGQMATVAHANGVTDRQDNDPRHLRRPALIRATVGPDAAPTNLWTSGAFSYDGAGNILEMGLSTFVYDKVSRLLDSNLYTNDLGTGSFKSQSYAFDGFGNLQLIATQIGTGNPVVRDTATSSTTNRLTALLAAYDARGNLTSTSGATYRYGPFNEAWRTTNGAEDWIHIYNADDERVFSLKIVPQASQRHNRWTLRDLGGRVLREYTQTGEPAVWTVANDYIYRDGVVLASDTPAGQRHFHLDHLGTPRLITNASGTKVAFHTYFPFGEEATSFSQDAERLKFTGHERDLGSAAGAGDDLDYMHARFCSPVTGRFLSVDPSQESATPGAPQSWNRFAYARNNPANRWDPDGRIDGGSGFNREIRTPCGNHACPASDPVSKTLAGITAVTAGAPLLAIAAVAAPEAGLVVAVRYPALFAGVMNFLAGATGNDSVSSRLAGFAATAGRAEVLANVTSGAGALRVSDTVSKQLSGATAGKVRSFIPTQAILSAIGAGERSADPQGVKGVFLYRIGAATKTTKGFLEVAVDEGTGTIIHVVYRESK